MSETRDTLELRLVPLRTVQRWDRNAKKHDLGALAESIARHGFRDPPSYDQALNGGAGGIVEGNGRADALAAMRAQGMPAPRGVRDTGDDWLVPVLFGLDAASQHAAEAYAITHNNLTMAGGDFTDLDMAGMWEPETYAAVLEDLARAGETPITVDETALDALLAALRSGAPTADAWGAAFGALPDGDRAPFQQMTFTLHDEQAETVKRALRAAQAAGPFGETGNENSNGNALARICEAYGG